MGLEGRQHISTNMLKPILLFVAYLCMAQAVSLSGRQQTCLGGKVHTVDYQVTHVGADRYVDLDSMTDTLTEVSCGIDHTKLILSFNSELMAIDFYLRCQDFNNHFMMGGQHWNCSSLVNDGSSIPSNILRRVVGATQDGHQVTVQTSPAKYDEIFDSAQIGYHMEAGSSCSTDKPICLGYNTDCSGAASAPLPLYSGQYIQASCADCFAGLKADVFANITIKGFNLEYLGAGFRNVSMEAGMVLDAQANGQTSLSLQRNFPFTTHFNIINFKVGPVPIMLWFDAAMAVDAEAAYSAHAEVSMGATGVIAMGDATISWDPVNRWQHSTLGFAPTMAHVLKTSATLDVTAKLTLNPSFSFHFDNVFDYSLNANPTINAEIQGSLAQGQVCLTSNYAMDVTAKAELKIDIPIIKFEKDWLWGPKVIANFSGVAIKQKCVPIPKLSKAVFKLELE